MANTPHINEYNILVYKDTKAKFLTGEFKTFKPSISEKRKLDSLTTNIKSNNYKTKIIVVNEDTFTVAQKMVDKLFNPLVLNMASFFLAGGGVEKGSQAQEENLFRRSNYFQCVALNLYPIGLNEVIYTPLVIVIKDNEYNLLKRPFGVACIAVAAIKDPPLTVDKKNFKNPNFTKLMEDKIRSIFQMAYEKGHDSVLLGALGCGAYHNPPELVAQIFNKVQTEFDGCFKEIIYAIYSVKDQNYDIFSKIIEQRY